MAQKKPVKKKKATTATKQKANNTTENKKSLYSLRFMFKVIKLVIMFLIIIGVGAGGLLGGLVLSYISTAPDIKPGDFISVQGLNSYVYDSKGNVIAELKKEENRVWINIEDVPENLVYAFIAIEDERFDEHPGVDFKRSASAILNYFKRLIDSSVTVHGGSTITQQLIKNLTGNNDNTPKRKIQEQWTALQWEKKLTKSEIMEMYLNTIPMGGNIYGIETAAKVYYDKDVRDLSLAECASLAGITNWPERYKPVSDSTKEKNLARKDLIIDKMYEIGKISEKEYNEAKKETINFVYNPQAGKIKKTSVQSYFVDEIIRVVKNDLIEQYGYSEQSALDIIYNSGIKIYTTMDPELQNALEDVITNDKYFPIINPRTDEHPQAAMVIMDPKNGFVRGIRGGYGEKESNVFNRATQAVRQPGSSIKPLLIYGPGIDSHLITPATVVDDVPQHMDNKKPEEIYPKNDTSINYGLTTVRDGLKHSRNVVAALLLRDYVGFDIALQYLAKVGIDRSDERYISIAMGGFSQGVTPLQMAAAYTTFANRGIYSTPVFYTQVENSQGKVILEKKPESKIVYSEDTTYVMNNMLQGVVNGGTGSYYGEVKNKDGERIPTGGKTGTTNDFKDKWFCGFSPYYVGVTWFGYDTPVPLQRNNDSALSEYNKALMIWNAVMNKVHENLEPAEFAKSDNIVKKKICIDSGLLATELCEQDPRGSRVREEIFIKGTEPDYSETCETHTLQRICLDAMDEYGRPMLASDSCPYERTEERVIIKRPEEYLHEIVEDPLPEDFMYTVFQNKYCLFHGNTSSGPFNLINPELDMTLNNTNNTTNTGIDTQTNDTAENTEDTNIVNNLIDILFPKNPGDTVERD